MRAASYTSVQTWYRPLMFGLTVPLLAFATYVFVSRAALLGDRGWLGGDYLNVMEFGRRWATLGTMYQEWQLAGPYDPFAMFESVGSLYPPVAGPILAAWTLIPWPLWWIIPIGIIAYSLIRWRPAPWTWPLLALVLALPETPTIILTGGTAMWTSAFVAAGLSWRWPAALLLLKPSLAPFALPGARDPRWWIVVGVVALGSLGGLADYLTVVWNGALPWWYSAGAAASATALMAAWWSSEERRMRNPSGRESAARQMRYAQ